MNRNTILLAPLCLVALTGFTTVAPSLPGHPGDSWSYYVTVTFTNQTNNVVATLKNGVLTRTVLKSTSPNRLLVEESTKGLQTLPGSGVIAPPDAAPLQTTYLFDGTVDQVSGAPSSESYRLLNLETVKLPSELFKTGLKWSWKVDKNPARSTPAMTADYTVVCEETVEGLQAWRVDFRSRETEGFTPAKIEGSVWFRKTDLVVLGIKEDGTNLPVPGKTDLVRRKLETSFIPEKEIQVKLVPPADNP